MRKLVFAVVPAVLLAVLLAVVLASACSRDSEAKDLPKPGPAAVAAKTGPRSEGQGYIVDVVPPASATAGAQGVIQVTLHPTPGYHVNKEFPMALTIVAPDGVDLPKSKLSAADAAKLTDDRADFAVAFTPKAAGDKAFTATFRFAVCTAETCDPKVEKLAWNVSVK
jgi:hypothetical protein